MNLRARRWVVAALVGFALGCARVSTTTLPSPASSGPPEPPGQITITASGVRPNIVHLFEVRGVVFSNTDARPHDMRADGTRNVDAGCSIVSVGRLEPGESRTTDVMSGFLGCYFRDELDPGNPAFQGFILSH